MGVIKFRWQLLVFDEIIFVYACHDIDIDIASSQIAFKKIFFLMLSFKNSVHQLNAANLV
jgi:hypothetical protein